MAASLVSGLFTLKRIIWDHRNFVLHFPEHKWLRIKRKACDEQVKGYLRTYMAKYWKLEDEKYLGKASGLF